MSKAEIRDTFAFERMMKRFAHVSGHDFDERNGAARTQMLTVANGLMQAQKHIDEAREGFAILVRVGEKYPDARFALRIADHQCRVCDRILDGRASPGDTHVVTKAEVLGTIGEIEHTEDHE